VPLGVAENACSNTGVEVCLTPGIQYPQHLPARLAPVILLSTRRQITSDATFILFSLLIRPGDGSVSPKCYYQCLGFALVGLGHDTLEELEALHMTPLGSLCLTDCLFSLALFRIFFPFLHIGGGPQSLLFTT
jgi:hypothetical protein